MGKCCRCAHAAGVADALGSYLVRHFGAGQGVSEASSFKDAANLKIIYCKVCIFYIFNI